MERPLEPRWHSGEHVPIVTVVIPAFNAESYITEALASIRAQTLRDIEVVVVDDGSSDGTVRMAARFARDLDLTVLTQTNAGPAAARNAGIRRARGRYCAFLDADDLMLPDRLAAQADLLDREADMALVYTDVMTFDDRGIIHRTRRAYSDPRGGMVLDHLLLDNFITTSTVMAPTSRLIEVGLFGEARRVSEDFELWLKMAARWQVGFIDRPLVQYRRRPGSLSDDKLATAQCALDVVETFWREHPRHRMRYPDLYRRSIAEHLAAVGSAAVARGSRGVALTYLMKALRRDPWKRRTWKSLVKALVRPVRLPSNPSPSVGAVRSA
jgi:glycosyltransferase involved in cell wall biosynthesis